MCWPLRAIASRIPAPQLLIAAQFHGSEGILSYGNRATRKFAKGDRRYLPPSLASKIDEVLVLLERGDAPMHPRANGYRIHRLTGDRKGAYAIEISGGWRGVFRLRDRNAHDVEVVDYHRS